MQNKRMRKALGLAAGLWLANLWPAAQAQAKINDFDSSQFTVKPFIDTGNLKCDLEASTGAKMNFVPNSRTQSGVELSIKNMIAIAIAGQGPMASEDESKKGRTDYQDYRLSLNFDAFQLFFAYARYQGFYIANTSYVDPTRSADLPYLQNPDLTLQNITAEFLWTASPEDFSLKALFDQTTRQEESGGSLLLGISAQDTLLSGQGPLIPASVRGEFGADQNIERGHFRTLLARLGYGYTFVLAKSWYFGLGMILGFGVQSGEYSDATKTTTSQQAPFRSEFFASLGYNGEHYFSGLSFLNSGTKYSTASLSVQPVLTSGRFFVGMRF